MSLAMAETVTALDPVHFSALKRMGQSPAHYIAAVQRTTGAMQKGTAVHLLVLGGKRVIAYPGPVRRGKEWEAFQADNPDAEILTRADYALAEGMANAVARHPEAIRVLTGRRELDISWSYLGRACQSRLDVLADDGSYVTELKTSVSAHPGKFAWQSLRMAYHAQHAFYRAAVISSGLGSPRESYVVAVESSAPYAVTVMRMTPRALERGERCFRLWFERLLSCEAANYWPAYCEAIVDLDVPDEEADLTFGDDDVPHSSPAAPF